MSPGRRLLCLASALVVAGLACKESGAPLAGNLKVTLTSPNNGADGAILVTVKGPSPLTGATPGTGLRLFSQPFVADSTRFVLTGPLASGVLLTIGVADTSKVLSYVATIQQTAAFNYQLRALSGYSLKVSK